MSRTLVQVQKLYDDAILPLQAYEDDAGWDLHVHHETWVTAYGWQDIATGVALAIPPGHYGRVVGRSSALRKRGLLVVEGIIDAGYRGEQMVCVYNLTGERVFLSKGDSLGQLIVSPIPQVDWVEVEELTPAARGMSGYGSSGR